MDDQLGRRGRLLVEALFEPGLEAVSLDQFFLVYVYCAPSFSSLDGRYTSEKPLAPMKESNFT